VGVSESKAWGILILCMSPNWLSIIGAALGLLSVFFAWIIGDARMIMHNPISSNGIEDPRALVGPYWFILDLIQRSTADMAMYGTLFLIGTVLAVATPLGGIAQATGLIGVILTYNSAENAFTTHLMSHAAFGAGYYLALLSTLLTIYSLKPPIPAIQGSRHVRVIGRVTAMSPRSTGLQR